MPRANEKEKTTPAHTPGPWTYDSVSDVVSAGAYTIAVHSGRNGHLIAAAPDLLEALMLVEAWESGKDVGPMGSDDLLRRVRTAIYKAEAR